MDGNPPLELTAFSCRYCYKQFSSQSDCAVHERTHLGFSDQLSVQGRPVFDHVLPPMYNASSAQPLESFDKLVQPLRNPGQDLRQQINPRAVVSPTGSDNSQMDMRGLNSQDMRNLVCTNQNGRNSVPASPSTDSVRSMVSSSPADQRNFIASSPVDPLSGFPASPVDGRNMVPHSPAGDQRNMLPNSPIDHRGSVDHRMVNTSRPQDMRNLIAHSPADQRNMIASSPVDHRNMVPASPVDQRLTAGHLDQRSIGSPADTRNMVSHSPSDGRSMPMSSQMDPRTMVNPSMADNRTHAIQSIVADIRNSAEQRSMPQQIFRPNESSGFSLVSRPMETLGLPGRIDGRMMPMEMHDMNHQSLHYGGHSFLESLTSNLYDPPSKPMTSQMYAATSLSSSDSRVYSQQSFPLKGNDNQAGGHGNFSKLLASPTQSSYYPLPYSSHAPPRYNMPNNMPQPGPMNYYNQGLTDPTAKVEQILPLPKQTLHYGQPPHSGNHAPQMNHSQYQDTIPKLDQHMQHQHHKLQQQQPTPSRPQIASPIPVHGSVGHVPPGYNHTTTSSQKTYSDYYKGSQSQTHIHSPVPSRPAVSQSVSTEKSQSVVGNSQGPVNQCYICRAPFADMNELSEHLKIHAQGMVNQTTLPQVSTLSSTPVDSQPKTVIGPPQNGPESVSHNMNAKPATVLPQSVKESPKAVEKLESDHQCMICGKTFVQPVLLSEHMKVHSSPEHYECNICKKQFKSKLKCARHEKVHQRDVRLFYCEVCDAGFEFKGNYVYHVVKMHGEGNVEIKDLKSKEPTAGTKKAVPLTGGSIDRSFESVESESDKYINCQVCDLEIEVENLVKHLKTHPTLHCEKCDQVFIHKTEYVTHLMSEHRNELPNAVDMLVSKSSASKPKDNVKTKSPKKEAAKKQTSEKLDNELVDVPLKPTEVVKTDTALKEERNEKREEINKKKEKVPNTKIEKKTPKPKVRKGIVYVDEAIEVDQDQKEKVATTADEESKFTCYDCNQAFTNQMDLSKHFGKHEKDPNRMYCEICNLSFQHRFEKGYYIYHIKYHCDAELLATNQPNDITCNICQKSFKKENLITHIRRDHAEYSCTICEWSYSSEKVLVGHMRKCHPKVHKNFVFVRKDYDATVLEYKTSTPAETVINDSQCEQGDSSKLDPSKTVPCPSCPRMFSKKHYLDRHVLKSHSTLESSQIACELCEETFSSKGTYLYHIQFHDGNLNEPVKSEMSAEKKTKCMKSESTEVKLEKGKESQTNLKIEKEDNEETMSKVENDDSGSSRAIKKEVKVEIKEKKEKTISVLNPVTGDFEEQTVLESDNEEPMVVDTSVFESDPVKSESEKEDVNEDNKLISKVKCRLCNSKVAKTCLSEHLKTHKLFNCYACEFTYLKAQKLDEHRQNVHLDEYIYDEIGKLKMDDHVIADFEASKTEETETDKESVKRKRGARLLNCSLCNKELKKDKYIEHLKSHIKPVFACEFCERSFSKMIFLKMHEKSHERIAHSKIELPHPKLCPVCSVKVESRGHYVSHLLEHRKKGSFQCNICELVFLSEKGLDNHGKVYHDPQTKVYWKLDGEGLKFDLRTGRVSEVICDHLSEIREINELLKQNGKPEILQRTTPKKGKEKCLSIKGMEKGVKKVTDAENSEDADGNTEEDENIKSKSDTSDEEYVPEESEGGSSENRSSGKILKKKDIKMKLDESNSSRKRRRSSRIRNDSGSEEEDDVDEESVSEKEHKPTATRTRKLDKTTNKKAKLSKGNANEGTKNKVMKLKKVGNLKVKGTDRVLRSTLEQKISKPHIRKLALKRTIHKKLKNVAKTLKGSSGSGDSAVKVDDNGEYPEKCPICGVQQTSKQMYDKHAMTHSECEICKKLFSSSQYLHIHIQFKHKAFAKKFFKKKYLENLSSKSTPIVGKLRTRAKNLETEEVKPISTSTPKRSPKLVIRLSPLNVNENKTDSSKNDSSSSTVSTRKNISKSENFPCQHCEKVYNFKTHFVRHMRSAHPSHEHSSNSPSAKSDTKKKEKQQKPFPCKNCSESFTKKRDLYIHTKVHQNDGETGGESPALSVSVDQASNFASENDLNVSAVKDSATDMSTSEDFHDGGNFLEESGSAGNADNNEEPSKIQRKRTYSREEKDSEIPEKKSRKDNDNGNKVVNENGKGARPISGKMNEVCETDTSDSVDFKGLGSVESSSQEASGCDNVSESGDRSERYNNNTKEKGKGTDSEVEGKKVKPQQPSVTKISAEKALVKWRAKVRDTLASQLELNATKKQEEIENPGVARIKEKLSTKTKSEIKNFECRICGDKFVEEQTFRAHMEEHMYESPPYCSICDIYFMAIYPKKRLAEHNKKKHPIAL